MPQARKADGAPSRGTREIGSNRADPLTTHIARPLFAETARGHIRRGSGRITMPSFADSAWNSIAICFADDDDPAYCNCICAA